MPPLLQVKVFPRARLNQVLPTSSTSPTTSTSFQIKTTAPAQNNQANLAALRLLAAHLHLKKSQLHLVKGATSREKIFEVIK